MELLNQQNEFGNVTQQFWGFIGLKEIKANVIRRLINISKNAMNRCMTGGNHIRMRNRRDKPILNSDTSADVTFLLPNLPAGGNLDVLLNSFKIEFNKQSKGIECPWNAEVDVTEQRLRLLITHPLTFDLVFHLIALENAGERPVDDRITFTDMGLKALACMRNYISRTPIWAALMGDMVIKKLIKHQDENTQSEGNILLGIMQRLANLPEDGEEGMDSQGVQLNFGPEANQQVAQNAQAILDNPNLLVNGPNPLVMG